MVTTRRTQPARQPTPEGHVQTTNSASSAHSAPVGAEGRRVPPPMVFPTNVALANADPTIRLLFDQIYAELIRLRDRVSQDPKPVLQEILAESVAPPQPPPPPPPFYGMPPITNAQHGANPHAQQAALHFLL